MERVSGWFMAALVIVVGLFTAFGFNTDRRIKILEEPRALVSVPETQTVNAIQPCVVVTQHREGDKVLSSPVGPGFQHVEKKYVDHVIKEHTPISHCIPCTRGKKTTAETYACDGGEEPAKYTDKEDSLTGAIRRSLEKEEVK